MVYFAIQGSFKPFTGKVIGFSETLNGVSIPHQIIQKSHGQMLLATDSRMMSWEKQRSEIGQIVSVEPKHRGPKSDYGRLLLDQNLGNVAGQVVAAKTFALGRNAFFADLLVDIGQEEYRNIAFRPWPSQKKTMALDLVGKTIALEDDQLFIIDAKGGRKAWPR